MTARLPPSAFVKAKLELAKVATGERFGRIYLNLYPEPLGFGKTPSRFSDPRRRVERNRFGVLYLGSSLKVCFVEAWLRDRRDGAIGDLPLSERELHDRIYAEIAVARELTLIDLRGDAAVRMGIPGDVARSSNQRLARAWSAAFYLHPDAPDGIIYPSRLNSETNLAIYDRAVPKLIVHGTTPLIAATGIATVLNELNIALVP